MGEYYRRTQRTTGRFQGPASGPLSLCCAGRHGRRCFSLPWQPCSSPQPVTTQAVHPFAVDSKAEHSVFSARDARWPRSRFSHPPPSHRTPGAPLFFNGWYTVHQLRQAQAATRLSFIFFSFFQIQLFYNRYLSNTDPACKHGPFNRLAKPFRTF